MNSIRNANQSDVKHIAQLWHSGWHDAHANIVPEQLTELRTIESFSQRTNKHLSNTRVAGSTVIQGMYVINDNELYQFYVSPEARGTGLAKSLIADAEQLMINAGNSKAWLACAIGNDRAAKFYRKCGWELQQTIVEELETVDGTFPLKVQRFEKKLG